MGPMFNNVQCNDSIPQGNTYFDPSCPIHLLQGNAGTNKDEVELIQSNRLDSLNDGQFISTDIGFGILTVTNSTHLNYKFFRSADLSIIA
jgi:hypothetical protein